MTNMAQDNKATHAPALALMASLAGVTENEELACSMVGALFPPDYHGNTLNELPEMFRSAVKKGIGKKRIVPDEYDPEEIGPVPQGYTDNGQYVFLDQKKRLLNTASPSALMSDACLCDMAPAAFWESICPKRTKNIVTGFDAKAIGDLLMRKCRNKGAFITSRIRGSGIWREGDKIVENLRGPVPQSRDFTYIRFGDLPEFATDNAITAKEIKDWLDLFNWTNPSSSFLLIGWLTTAPLCGALKWRVHMFLNGPKDTGKSTLIDGLAELLSPLVVHVQGSSTEAGIRQMIGADSKACLIDEFESDQNRGRMQSILRLVRSSSSAKSTIARGTVEGKAIQYQVYCAFLLGAIIPIKGSNADQSRIVEIELKPHAGDPAIKEQIDNGLRRISTTKTAWAHRMQGLIYTILDSIDIFEKRLDGESRHRLNMSVLLGGAFAALHERTPSETEADAVIAEHKALLSHLAQAHDENDADDCLNRLLTYQVEDEGSVGDLLAKVAREKYGAGATANYENAKILERVGIKIADDGFLVANIHAGLDAVFKDSIWAGGSWPAALRRLEGAQSGNEQRRRFSGGKAVRCTYIPFPNFDESDGLEKGKKF